MVNVWLQERYAEATGEVIEDWECVAKQAIEFLQKLRRKREAERVTAALDKNLVQWMDQQIEKGTYRSRTHCIEDCIRAKKT